MLQFFRRFNEYKTQHWLRVEDLKKCRQFDKIKNTSYQRQVVKCNLFLTFNKSIHLSPSQSFRYLLNI